MNSSFKQYLLNVTQATDVKKLDIIQSLWGGYGKILRYSLRGPMFTTVVVKHISLGQSSDHPRGWNTNRSHERKVKSYEIETHWYQTFSQYCTNNCRIPKFIGSFAEGTEKWIVLEDLNDNFPLRKYDLEMAEVKGCLRWLANFHAIFLDRKPDGLWKVGTYWHLETRPDEFEKIDHQALKANAHKIDQILNQCKYQTIVHGDAKLANFCFSDLGDQIAAVDFQYVGGGCGMKDVAYFLGSCLTSDECTLLETELLNSYFSELRIAIEATALQIKFEDLELEWRRMYPFACADFTRFLLGWMPTHQKINDYNRKLVDVVLAGLLD